MKNIDKHREDAKWLVETLDELVADSSDEETQKQQGALESVIERYNLENGFVQANFMVSFILFLEQCIFYLY